MIELRAEGLMKNIGFATLFALLAVTGAKISPGLFESLELLGREESLRRLSAAVAAA